MPTRPTDREMAESLEVRVEALEAARAEARAAITAAERDGDPGDPALHAAVGRLALCDTWLPAVRREHERAARFAADEADRERRRKAEGEAAAWKASAERERERATVWLKARLGSAPAPVADVLREAEAAGHPATAIHAAAGDVAVRLRKWRSGSATLTTGPDYWGMGVLSGEWAEVSA